MAQAFQFSSPSNYSDWANYAGFDRTTGEQKSYAPEGGVAPTNISEFMDQAIAPAQQKMDMLSGVASNIGQGNMSGAYNAFKPKPMQKLAPVGTPVNDGFGFHIDDLEH
jgi:hypothetical protein